MVCCGCSFLRAQKIWYLRISYFLVQLFFVWRNLMNKDVSKAIYKELRNRVINIPPAQEKYGCPFFNDTLIGQKSIACLILSPRTQCCVNFNSNYLTDDLVTNAFLYERGVVLSPVCPFCRKENESLEQLLILSFRYLSLPTGRD